MKQYKDQVAEDHNSSKEVKLVTDLNLRNSYGLSSEERIIWSTQDQSEWDTWRYLYAYQRTSYEEKVASVYSMLQRMKKNIRLSSV